jgi:hypothetical protein
MDTTLRDLVKQYQQYKTDASLDLDNWDFRTRAGMQMRKNRGIAGVEEVQEKYFIAARQRAVGIFLTGEAEAIEEFIEIAQAETAEAGGVIVLSANKLYEDLAKETTAGISGGRFSPNEYARLIFLLREIAHKLRLSEFQKPELGGLMARTADLPVITREIKKAIEAGNAYRLAGLFLEEEVAKEALKRGYSQPVIPVILTGATKEDVEGLKSMFTSRVSFAVSLDGVKVDQELVLKTLKDIKKDIKKKLKNDPDKNDEK